MKTGILIPLLLVYGLPLIPAALAQQADDEAHVRETAPRHSASPARRDPFWPVGYWPAAPEDPGAYVDTQALQAEEEALRDAARWEAAAAQLRISGISRLGSRVFVSINGRPYEEGDICTAQHGGRTFRWEVQSITSDGVRLRPIRNTEQERVNANAADARRREPVFIITRPDEPSEANQTNGE